MSQTMALPMDVAAQIADTLGETAPEPPGQIMCAVAILGAEPALAFLTEAQETERNGGLMTSRRPLNIEGRIDGLNHLNV